MVIFNITSADFVWISADVILKMTAILNQLRIAQLCSKNGRILGTTLSRSDVVLFQRITLKYKGVKIFMKYSFHNTPVNVIPISSRL